LVPGAVGTGDAQQSIVSTQHLCPFG